MKDHMEVVLYALDIEWENPELNFRKIESSTQNLDCDILILPEMYSTGFSMNAKKIAESESGESLSFLKYIASKLNSVVCASIPIRENGQFYNRFFWVEPDAHIERYDKRHLFTLAGEHNHYTSGQTKNIIDYQGWKICPMICYDLRFPVWSRNVEDYHLCIYVANWPTARDMAWQRLLQARAIENMSYVAGVNRSGKDGNLLEYSGFSTVYDVMGTEVKHHQLTPGLKKFSISQSVLHEYRSKFKFLQDRDAFTWV